MDTLARNSQHAQSDVETLEAEVPAALPSVGSAEVDMQIATAKRFPRSIASFKKAALEMACLDEETAEACFYALPRDGKTVEGPSARLAEICASAWGNLRVEARQVGEDDRFVTSRGVAWDLQTNVAIAYEVKRRITTSAKRDGGAKKYSDDMIGVTSNAASSIALRNAVFKVIPAAFWKPIYVACRHTAVGDIKTLANRRAVMLEHFQKLGATGDQVFTLLGVKGVEDITLDHMATLKGLASALKEGETTIEDAFSGSTQAPIKAAERKSEQAKDSAVDASQQGQARTRETPSAVSGAVGGPTAEPPAVLKTAKEINEQNRAVLDGHAAENLPLVVDPKRGTIVDVLAQGTAAVVTLSTGFKCSTKVPALIESAKNLLAAKRAVELTTTTHAQPDKYMDRLDEILPVTE